CQSSRVPWHVRQLIAFPHLDIALGISKGIELTGQCERGLECRIGECIVAIGIQPVIAQPQAGLIVVSRRHCGRMPGPTVGLERTECHRRCWYDRTRYSAPAAYGGRGTTGGGGGGSFVVAPGNAPLLIAGGGGGGFSGGSGGGNTGGLGGSSFDAGSNPLYSL